MLMHDTNPIFALCGIVPHQAIHIGYGPIEADGWNPAPDQLGGFRGLPWGKGDPQVAYLEASEWAVVRVDDPEGPVAIPASSGDGIAAIKFRTGTVIYNGPRRGALEALILLGANSSNMSVTAALPSVKHGVADVGPYGIAIATKWGLARGAEYSQVFALGGGIAVAGQNGFAEGSHTAIVGAEGCAYVGDLGLAIGRGQKCSLHAGERGTTIALGHAREFEVGVFGLAIALRGAESIRGGEHSIAIVRASATDRVAFRMGEGSVIVLSVQRSEGPPQFIVTGVGRRRKGDLNPGESYIWEHGEFRTMYDHEVAGIRLPNLSYSESSSEEDDGADLGSFFQPQPLELERPIGNDVVVLCCAHDEWVVEQTIEAENWNADPTSSAGFHGLAWGIGAPAMVDRYLNFFGQRYALLRVAQPNAISLGDADLLGGPVRFARGEVLYIGLLSDTLARLVGMGINPADVFSQIANGNDGEIVRVPDYGVARAGMEGWAIAGSYGDAAAGRSGLSLVKSNGIARCGNEGIAIVQGDGTAYANDRGIAISDCKRFGRAVSGHGGVAINRGSRWGEVRVSGGGVAAYLGSAGRIEAGDDSIAFGSGNCSMKAGRNGLAVSRNGAPNGGPGCLLVSVRDTGDYNWAVVGEDGRIPEDFSRWTEQNPLHVSISND
jgi:hypothetical protein